MDSYPLYDSRGMEVGGKPSESAAEALRLAEALTADSHFKHLAPFTCHRRTEEPMFRVKRDGGYESLNYKV